MPQCVCKNESLHSCLPLFPAGAIFPATLAAIKHDSRPPLLLYSHSDLLLKDHCNNYKLQNKFSDPKIWSQTAFLSAHHKCPEKASKRKLLPPLLVKKDELRSRGCL